MGLCEVWADDALKRDQSLNVIIIQLIGQYTTSLDLEIQRMIQRICPHVKDTTASDPCSDQSAPYWFCSAASRWIFELSLRAARRRLVTGDPTL